MRIKSEKVSDIKKKLEVTLPIGRVQEALDVAYGKIQQKAKLKGFRPGKVPRSMLETHYRGDAEEQALQDLVSASYGPALDEAKEFPVSHPEIKVTQFASGKELVYEAIFETKPEVTVKKYQGIKLTQSSATVTDQEIEENLKRMQDQAAQLVPVVGRVKPQAGDFVVVDYVGYQDGKPVPKGSIQDYTTPLGTGALFPEIESGLLEMAVKDKKRIQVTFPADFTDKNLAGKKVEYEMTLKEIKEKKLPELNDDFAKDLGVFQTLAEVKQKLREELGKRKEAEAKGKLHRQLIEHLSQENPFTVPEGMVQAELGHMYRRFEENLKQQKMTPQQVGVTPELFARKNREEAIVQVKGALYFDAIARAENIQVSPEEVKAKIAEMAKSMNQPPEQWYQYYQEKQLLPGLTAALREEKTLAFVLSKATIKVEK